MRKVTEKAAQALLRGNRMTSGNTQVRHDEATGISFVQLYGTIIVSWDKREHTLTINTGGWYTNTTKERLNGIFEVLRLNVSIVQRNGEWLLNQYDDTGELTSQQIYHDGWTIGL